MNNNMNMWKCANCGRDNPGDTGYCSNCGSPRPAVPSGGPSRAGFAPRPAAAQASYPAAGAAAARAPKLDKKWLLAGIIVLAAILIAAAAIFFIKFAGKPRGDFNAVAETLEMCGDDYRDFQERNFIGQPVRTVFTKNGVETESLVYTRDKEGHVVRAEHYVDGELVGHVDTERKGNEAIEKYYFHNDSTPYRTEEIKFNKHDDIIWHKISGNENSEEFTDIKYDRKDRIISSVRTDKSGKVLHSSTYEYIDDRKSFDSIIFEDGGEMYEYVYYDEQDRPIRTEILDDEAWNQGREVIQMVIENTFDEDGHIIKSSSWWEDEPIPDVITYMYTPFGFRYASEDFDSFDGEVTRTIYVYNIWGYAERMIMDADSSEPRTYEYHYDVNGLPE